MENKEKEERGEKEKHFIQLQKYCHFIVFHFDSQKKNSDSIRIET